MFYRMNVAGLDRDLPIRNLDIWLYGSIIMVE